MKTPVWFFILFHFCY